jgi:hypothetical protein
VFSSVRARVAPSRFESESPRGSLRNDSTSVPLDEAYTASGSVIFVLYMEECVREGGEGGRTLCLQDFTQAWKAGPAGITYKSATRPVGRLTPSQVPPASLSRPESTRPLSLSPKAAGPPSLRVADLGIASNEWK